MPNQIILWALLLANCLVPVLIGEDTPKTEIATIAIAGGTFTMGSPLSRASPEFYEDERPVEVNVPDFHIGRYLISVEQICAFLNSNPRCEESILYRLDIPDEAAVVKRVEGKFMPRPGSERSPAKSVTWKGAVLFCQWMSRRDGKNYRLPSEAEWELAARGIDGRKWPWGHDPPTPKHGLVFARPSFRRGPFDPPVGSYPANSTPQGVCDMLGYYCGEWCANKYIVNPSAEQATDVEADLSDLIHPRVLRGYYRKTKLRFDGPLGRLLGGAEIGWTTTEGRVWTRTARIPSEYAGFRVVKTD